uniref:Protein kinase domain-containing protein n=1 Tax=Nothobranchius furzeri TaxID=105023 RepID=A0A8C6M4I2_NOTFU
NTKVESKQILVSHYRKFSQIAECRNERTGEILAIKFVKKKFHSQNRREVRILKQLKSLNLPKCYVVNFSECFSYQDRTCFAYEKLDSTFLELVLAANGKPVHLTEIRAIAFQMLVALGALNYAGITHANLKPENIMTMDGLSHQYGVKLIGFSNSAKTSELCDLKIPLDCGYTAPEVFLDCPLDESLDIWSLGCTLAFLFLGQHMSPVDCEYQYMSEVKKTDCNNLTDLNDFLFKSNQPEPIAYDDTEAFIDLLRKMLNVDPALRIKPADALKHPFITMTHLRYISDEFYLTESQRIMKECQFREEENTYSSLSTPSSKREQTPDLDFSFLYQEFELLDQTLFDYLKKRGDTLKVAELRAIAQQILVALSALKQLGITHTDLKLDNIMLVNHEEQPIKVKLIDFGFACETETLKEKGILHNLAYRAPEITLGLPRDEAIDTWSL